MLTNKIDELRSNKEKVGFQADLLLFGTYFFSLLDLILTAYVQSAYPFSQELNPLYHIGGWDLLVWFKLLGPFAVWLWSVKHKTLIPLYIILMLMISVCFWNVLVVLNI